MAEQKYQANPDFLARTIGDDTVLVPTGAAAARFNGMASLDEAGALLWKALAQPQTLAQLLDVMQAEYEIPDLAQAQQDVAEFVQNGLESGVLTIAE